MSTRPLTLSYLINNDLDEIMRAFFGETPKGSSSYYCPSFPPSDVYYNSDTHELEFNLALAGFKKDGIEVSFEGDFMIITLTPPDKKEEKRKILNKSIKMAKHVSKFFVPAQKYDTDNAKASFEDGILKINISANEKVKPKKLLIT